MSPLSMNPHSSCEMRFSFQGTSSNVLQYLTDRYSISSPEQAFPPLLSISLHRSCGGFQCWMLDVVVIVVVVFPSSPILDRHHPCCILQSWRVSLLLFFSLSAEVKDQRKHIELLKHRMRQDGMNRNSTVML